MNWDGYGPFKRFQSSVGLPDPATVLAIGIQGFKSLLQGLCAQDFHLRAPNKVAAYPGPQLSFQSLVALNYLPHLQWLHTYHTSSSHPPSILNYI